MRETIEIQKPESLEHRPITREARLDVQGLAEALEKRVRGEVRFDNGSRALYATDASNYRMVPLGVVIPLDEEDVVETIAAARSFGAPILHRGGGTGLAGQTCNSAVVIDHSKYFHGADVDFDEQRATVRPGIRLDELRAKAEKGHLTFGPDPATHKWCTLGGMMGNNSCGIHSVMAGRTVDNVEDLEILTYDGMRLRVGKTSDAQYNSIVAKGGREAEIFRKLKDLADRYGNKIRERYPNIPRRVSGYSLDQLLPENGFHVARSLIGSEGTCVTILKARLMLVPSPPSRTLVVLGYPDVYTAGDHVTELLKYKPVGLEGIDNRLTDYMRRKRLHPSDIQLLPKGGGWLLIEFGGETADEAEENARKMMDDLSQASSPPSMKLFKKREEQEHIWEIRESGLGATAHVKDMPDTWPGWEDSAVPPEKLGSYLRDLRKLLDQYGYQCALYGHFGQACVHTRIDFDLKTEKGIKHYLAFVDDAADLVVHYGGSFSGEHGDGQSRGQLLPKMFGPDLINAFREFKSIWDPDWKMNPGKVVDPFRIDENLRLGSGYNPWDPPTHFQFPHDHGSFAEASLRCVGVGKCRRTDGGIMCPSYMVTREEEHTTRGRAHLLFEMLQGQEIANGWKDEHVKGALDLCLSCKGCKGDCPVHVDIATYRAEFLSHYYEGRLRPRSAYAFGLIYWWSRLASVAPNLVNFFTQTPGLSRVAKLAAGMAPERHIPPFASQTFRSWFRKRRAVTDQSRPRVLLWPDTFNNHFHTATAKAAVEVLEAGGYRVEIPRQSLCCGRPLYDYGMLDTAKKLLRETMTSLRNEIEAEIPMVVLEPSCASVFKDELGELFPHQALAQKLSKNTYMLADFVEEKVKPDKFPRLNRKAVVHGHCHHKAILEMPNETKLLKQIGLDINELESGCCGMAGAFGFEKGVRYQVSIGAGERVLLPAVREAEKGTLIVADGFSCREQISQTTDREALHTAQVLAMAIKEGPDGPAGSYPEAGYVTRTQAPRVITVVGLAAVALAGYFLARKLRLRQSGSRPLTSSHARAIWPQ